MRWDILNNREERFCIIKQNFFNGMNYYLKNFTNKKCEWTYRFDNYKLFSKKQATLIKTQLESKPTIVRFFKYEIVETEEIIYLLHEIKKALKID